jgi:DNA-directed RNA polymerase specialized sigma24 family protein
VLATTTPDLASALQGLPPEEATALLFASLPGITYREVAARLGEEPAVILRRLRKGLQALRPVLASPA